MLAILRNTTFRHLFAAQIVALLGTGLATVALALLALAALAVAGLGLASRFWPARDLAAVMHAHPGLAQDHPHLLEFPAESQISGHKHVVMIDDLHQRWPG